MLLCVPLASIAQTFEMDFTFTSAPMLNFDKTRTAFRAAFGKVVDNKASVKYWSGAGLMLALIRSESAVQCRMFMHIRSQMFMLSKKNSIFEFLQEGVVE